MVIQRLLIDDAEIASGDISIFGIDVSLFVPSYAEDTSTEEGGGGGGTQVEYNYTDICEACWNNGQVYMGTQIRCKLGGVSCTPDLYCSPTSGCGL